jgi:hypothetical protein
MDTDIAGNWHIIAPRKEIVVVLKPAFVATIFRIISPREPSGTVKVLLFETGSPRILHV